MSRKGQSITLSVSERDKKKLEDLALELGYTWGNRPNISKLVEAIARGDLEIGINNDWSQDRINALESARKALIDGGRIGEAIAIAELLQERSELAIPFRQEIEKFLNKPISPWRKQIDQFINRQQPFRLSYRNATDHLYQYTIIHGQIRQIEKREYLLCRAEEREGNQDLSELSHNWTLRLDRITEAAVVAIEKPWESDLEKIEVEFRIYGGLAFGYNRGTDDNFVSELEGDPPFKTIVREVFSTFWFFRDIAKYYDNCEIIGPPSVREHYQQKILSLYQRYYE